MKLAQLAKKPQLIKVSIDDAEIVAEFGEPLEFWTWDRQPMETFLRLAALDQSNTAAIIESVRGLVLDEEGNTVLTGENTLPTKVLMRVITAVIENLGK